MYKNDEDKVLLCTPTITLGELYKQVRKQLTYEKFEDTKEVIRIRKSKKNRQNNDQKKHDKTTNNNFKKTKDRATRNPMTLIY